MAGVRRERLRMTAWLKEAGDGWDAARIDLLHHCFSQGDQLQQFEVNAIGLQLHRS